ncbi:unnamed protein product [Pseudo-nitzschia multistriata]|uniref:Uncharacterized protein n=1 Tax=Pseudo-nitzschia multistriata TaxID=183589 RepID=A0A448ZMM1_9STRA|nr:unnamed protein product [Pseudo-nitzschia multistriata]
MPRTNPSSTATRNVRTSRSRCRFVALLVAATVPGTALGLATNGRRGFLASVSSCASAATVAALCPLPSAASQEVELRQGNQVTAFNGLAFNYRGGEYGGLDASTLDEPSISYSDFNEKLRSGGVVFVEFKAPDGDVAYATLRGEGDGPGQRLRIGEGYPIEQHDGYSSPMFCIRTVKNAGVPYKFVVKGLDKYSQ